MAESMKGVEENDKGTEGKRGGIGARGETRNGRREQEEEKEDDDTKEEGRERAAKGKNQATCTRQQPPTSEELIINLLSPSPNAAVLTRPPSLHFHLRLSRLPPSLAPLMPPPSLSLILSPSLPFPFIQSFPPFSLFSLLLPSSSPTLRRVACLRLRLLALSLSPPSLRGLAFDLASVLSTSKPCRYFRSI